MIRRVALALAVLTLLGAVAVGGAVAQADDRADQRGADGAENTTSVVAQVDDDVRVLSYSYDGETATFAVELENTGGRSTHVTLTEIVDPDSDGSGGFGVQQPRLRPGETVVVEVDADRRRGTAGVMLTTPASLDRGSGVYLADTTSISIFEGGATWADVRAAVLATLGAALAIVVLGAWDVVARKSRDVKEVSV